MKNFSEQSGEETNQLEANAYDVTSGMGYIGRKVLRQTVKETTRFSQIW